MATVVELADVDASWIASVGGKAASLGELVKAGERVPDGFCITVAAQEQVLAGSGVLDAQLRQDILRAYERLGAAAVAVRSSATAEDLPQASFAGQHETVLNVRSAEGLLEAVRRCWDSLSSPRAVAYREAADIATDSARMGVVVQRMVEPVAAGVLFTANPITGTRTEMVVDAVAGLGDVVVDGSAKADHYVLNGTPPQQQHGCLGQAQLSQLWETGTRLAHRAGAPQDIEWAIDGDGVLWLLQARPITTLFPLPASAPPGPRVYLEGGHMQGMLRPFTPMGMSVMRIAMTQWLASVGVRADPFEGHNGLVDAAGRMFIDLTPFVRNKSYRAKLPDAMQIYGPRAAEALERVLEDPRFAPQPGLPFPLGATLRAVAQVAPGMIAGLVRAMVNPAGARRVALQATIDIRKRVAQQDGSGTAAERVRLAARLQAPFILGSMTTMLPPLYGAMLAKAVAIKLLAGVATASEVDETLRGMPHNVTTEMDLSLWRVAAAAGKHRELLSQTPPAELAARYRAARLPEIGIGEFLAKYGHRGAAEIDVGVARWAEDPTPVFAALAGYLRVTDPEQAADYRFAKAATEAVAKIDELVDRARRARPIRGRVAGLLLRRSRALAGFRELPKFAWLYVFAAMRAQLLAAGADLQARGLLNQAEDIMYLDMREALAAANGDDLRALIAERRSDYQREMRRRHVPTLLLSDGTNPETLTTPSSAATGNALTGMAAAPGRATGPARVILDPANAHVEPGEILIAPTTDPGWTPLFLTAAGLVTETGAAMAHGPTVAREYGIPAVICVRDATHLIQTGQIITIDGSAGVVALDETTEDAMTGQD